jgi:hypothetical protein
LGSGTRLLSVALWLGFACSACISQEYESAVTALAAKQLGCPAPQLKAKEMYTRGGWGLRSWYRVEGCGKAEDYDCYHTGSERGAQYGESHCSAPPKTEEESLRRSASQAVFCAPSKVTAKLVEDYDPKQPFSVQIWEVTGCGNQHRFSCWQAGHPRHQNEFPWPSCDGLKDQPAAGPTKNK